MNPPSRRAAPRPTADDAPTPDVFLADRSESLRGALVRYFFRRVGNLSEVDDLVQDVFLRIVRRGAASELEKFEGYVFKTAASVLADRARRRKVRHAALHVAFEPEIHAGQTPGPERTVLEQEALQAVGVALLQLPERTRQVFVLRRIEGLSSPEVGRRLGISPSSVDKHMLKAMAWILARTRDAR